MSVLQEAEALLPRGKRGKEMREPVNEPYYA